VILDSDLADLYGVPVKRLSEQVKRNIERFPHDFAFVLTKEENEALRSQIATLHQPRQAALGETGFRPVHMRAKARLVAFTLER
jgi:hypothetical protein